MLVDEATMVKESDLLLPIKNAEQLVMVGDQKQLGPTFEYQFEGYKSLFTRLIANEYSFFTTLET